MATRKKKYTEISMYHLTSYGERCMKIPMYLLIHLDMYLPGARCNIRDLTEQDGWKTQDGRMTYKNVAQDRECTVSRNIFSSFCRPESSSRPVA